MSLSSLRSIRKLPNALLAPSDACGSAADQAKADLMDDGCVTGSSNRRESPQTSATLAKGPRCRSHSSKKASNSESSAAPPSGNPCCTATCARSVAEASATCTSRIARAQNSAWWHTTGSIRRSMTMRTSTRKVSGCQHECFCKACKRSSNTSKRSPSLLPAFEEACAGRTRAHERKGTDSACLFRTQLWTTAAASTNGASSWHFKNFMKCCLKALCTWSSCTWLGEKIGASPVSGKAQASASATVGMTNAEANGSKRTRLRSVSKTWRMRKRATVGDSTRGGGVDEKLRSRPLTGWESLSEVSEEATLERKTGSMAQFSSLSASTSLRSATLSSKTSER
mmetsp:Transcript_46374/g.91986  ORF Transcript_46374/g.91986 Transcript_46374/m.91986 type:complete len:340 (+) Transcript_46374:636-1655(+)